MIQPPGTSQVSGNRIRRVILEQSKRANVGHIGSGLSVADILAALYGGVLNLPAVDHPDRDRFILSKGHAVLGLYAALHLRGWLSAERLGTYCGEGSVLGVHPEHVLRGIDFSSGSLGQGLSIGAGAALAARLKGSSRRVFVLVSDAECNEGQVWEAAMFAAHHALSNVVAIVDLNGLQALGHTREILALDMAALWSSFGWDTVAVDGHDLDALQTALQAAPRDGAPRAIVARTLLGKGVSFMEDRLEWHYRNLTPELARRALDELAARE